MDIITKRAHQHKKIMSIIDSIELTDDPVKDFAKVKNQMLQQDLIQGENITFAKHYFSEVMLNPKEKVEKQ